VDLEATPRTLDTAFLAREGACNAPLQNLCILATEGIQDQSCRGALLDSVGEFICSMPERRRLAGF